jgi:hypothetical protein
VIADIAGCEIDSVCETDRCVESSPNTFAKFAREIYGNPRPTLRLSRPFDRSLRARVNRQNATREAESAGTLFGNVTDRWMCLAVTETSRFSDDPAVDRWVTSLANWTLKGRGERSAAPVNGKLMIIISRQRY